jgi:hypothetical protein
VRRATRATTAQGELVSCSIALHFASSRASDGTDIASIAREQLPDAMIDAHLDDAGAVEGYTVTIEFPDSDRAADAAFRLRDFFDEAGIPVTFDDPSHQEEV